MKTQVDTPNHPHNPTVGFQRILVTVDYSNATPEVFQQACDLAYKDGSKLMIFHSVPGHLPGIQDLITASSISAYGGVYSQDILQLEEQLVQEVTQELHQWLKGFCQTAKAEGIDSEYDYYLGEPGKQICAKAKEWDADLIVLGRRGRSGLSEILLGSVSNYVIHHAHCSVLIVQ